MTRHLHDGAGLYWCSGPSLCGGRAGSWSDVNRFGVVGRFEPRGACADAYGRSPGVEIEGVLI
ncbi:hypothetical protein [Streptomyces sp. 4N124]|uniref:hypothetical protein n=1 Tax=Streptomyces sp. 4N124 TaxID=3457420 RepID=UPI003FD56A26